MTTVINKGQIGEQDIYRFDGSGTNTFTRDTSTGKTLTLNKVGYEVNALSAYGGGALFTDATVTAALTAIGTTTKATLFLAPGTWVFNENIDYSAYTNITFKLPPGAVISHSTYTLNIPNIEAGLYQIFTGTGAVTGLRVTYPQWFGAVTGWNQTNAQRTINTAAIQAAWDALVPLAGTPVPTSGQYLYEIWYGTLMIEGFFETNGDIVVGTDITGGNAATRIKGSGAEQSCIWSFGTGNVIDAVGRRRLTFQDIKIASKTAAVGLLLGRIGGGQGSNVHLSGVDIVGSFSTACLVGIAAEMSRAVNCYFQNGYIGAAVYASSTRPDLIGVTSTQGTILTSTNSDIRFTNCTFYSTTTGMDVIRFDTNFDGSFASCILLAGVSDATNNLIRLIADPFVFDGQLTFTDCLLEGDHVTLLYHDYDGDADTTERSWKNIAFRDCVFTIFDIGETAAPVVFDYKTRAHSTHHYLVMDNIKYASAVSTINLNNLVSSRLYLPRYTLDITGFVVNSNIEGYTVTWETNAYSLRSTIVDVNSHIIIAGSAPYNADRVATVSNHNSANRLKAVMSGMYEWPATPIAGEIFSIDGGMGNNLTVASSTGMLVPMFWNGYNFLSMGAVPGTVSAEATTGVAGTMAYDTTNFYLCTTSGTSGTLNSGSTTGSIESGSKTLTVNSATGLTQAKYITIAGVTGTKRVTAVSGTTITIDTASDATVTDAAVAYKAPVWKKAAWTAW